VAPPASLSARRSIRWRILAAFVLSLASWVGAFGYTYTQLQEVGRGIAVLDLGYLPLADVAARLEAAARQLDREQERLSRDTGPQAAGLRDSVPRDIGRPVAGARTSAALHRASLEEAARAGRTVAQAALTGTGTEGALVGTVDPADAAAIEACLRAFSAIEAQAQAYEEAVDAWASAVAAEEGGEARAQADLALIRTQLVGTSGDLAALVESRIQRVAERTAEAQRRALTVGGAAGLLAIAMAGLMAGAAILSLQPVARLTEQVQRLAAGQQPGGLATERVDEVGLLAREFGAMAEAVAERDRRLSERAAALDRLSLRLRSILDAIHAGVVLVEDGRVASANPAAGRLWGLEVGQPLPDWLRELPLGRHEHVVRDERIHELELAAFGAEGRLIVGEDVTERVQDRSRLARTERLALVGQMLAQVTHEVRNPLNAMSLHAELLAEEVVGRPEAEACLATISTEIARLEQVTARYLDLSRRRAPEPTSESPRALLEGVLRTEEELWRRAGAQVLLEGEETGVMELPGDTLRAAVRNLVRNAVEAGARRVHVRLLPYSPQAEEIQVEVEDDGPGIAQPDVERVFEPFYTTKVKGTGLGLAITRQELEEAGGRLSLVEAPGAGCLFRLTLPCRPSPGTPP